MSTRTLSQRRTAGLTVILLSSLACVVPGLAPLATPSGAVEDSTSSEINFPADGQLAVVGEDGNLYLIGSGALQAVTSDAEMQGSARRAYAHPSWSPDGWLSYVQVETEDEESGVLRVLAVKPGHGEPRELYQTDDHNYIYGYWSPAPCASGSGCGRLAFLMTDQDSLTLHLAEVTTDESQPVQQGVIGRASPFYYSWSPDGAAMLWFRNGDRLSVYDVALEKVIEELADIPGLFQSPIWSGAEWLYARKDDGRNRLIVAGEDEAREVGQPVSGVIFFGRSPDARQIAYAGGGFPLSGLTVLDVSIGDEFVYENIEDVVSFFWSPDSTRLAVITVEEYQPLPEARQSGSFARPARQDSEPEIRFVLNVVDTRTHEVNRLEPFFPTEEQFYMLQFFDQYAQSHRLWSPDGRYFVLVVQAHGSEKAEVWLVDMDNPTLEPLVLMEGRLAIFSFE